MTTMKKPAARDLRLRNTRRIGELFEIGRRVSDSRMTVLAAENGLGWHRVAYAVNRRHGSAVRRNRVRRLCREAVRRNIEQLPAGLDLVVMPRVRDDHTVDKLAESLAALVGRLGPVGEARP